MLIKYQNEDWWKNFFAEAAAIAIDKGYMDDYVEYLVPGIEDLRNLEDETLLTETIDKLNAMVMAHFKSLFDHDVEEYI